ncbi:hypothetical protein GCM10010439_58560 [Actinocorallia aurantiaca]|uniref:Uncharacterized protein n=1 Tax=Actinocorallia aurantiaca TaxID=46204 RepID=A0ABN3UL37_9ACTN
MRDRAVGIDRTVEQLGESRPLGSVADNEVGEALKVLRGARAVNTWNAGRAAVGSWPTWRRDRGHDVWAGAGAGQVESGGSRSEAISLFL